MVRQFFPIFFSEAPRLMKLSYFNPFFLFFIKKVKYHPDDQDPWPRYQKSTHFAKKQRKMTKFRRFWVKEPRHSENIFFKMVIGWFTYNKKKKCIPWRTSTPLFRFRPWNFAHVFLCAIAKDLTCRVFFFFLSDFFVSQEFFGKKCGPPSTKCFGEKTRKKKTPGGQTSGWACRTRTCAKIQGLSLQNGVGIWAFVRESE